MESLITAIIVILIVGVLVWAINTYLPVAQPFKGIIIVLLVLVACLYLLKLAGLFSY